MWHIGTLCANIRNITLDKVYSGGRTVEKMVEM